MTTQEQVQSYLEQPKRYFNIDGLGEIDLGVMVLGFALAGWLSQSTPTHSLWNRPWVFLIYVALMLAAMDRGTKFIKKRITYPRTGFVEYRQGAKSRMATMALGAATAVVFVLLMVFGRVNAAALMGMVLIPSYAYGIARAVRWKWLVVAVLAVGTLAIASLPAGLLVSLVPDPTAGPKSRFPADLAGSCTVEELFIGVTFLVSGGITMYRYLSRTQAPEQAAE